MQPKIISKDILYITGFTGDGTKTGEVWSYFDNQYNKNPFRKADENGYEIRFYDGEKPVIHGKDIHLGFATESADNVGNFSQGCCGTVVCAVARDLRFAHGIQPLS